MRPSTLLTPSTSRVRHRLGSIDIDTPGIHELTLEALEINPECPRGLTVASVSSLSPVDFGARPVSLLPPARHWATMFSIRMASGRTHPRRAPQIPRHTANNLKINSPLLRGRNH